MENKEDILKQLANYEVKPPDFLTRKVLDGYAKNLESFHHLDTNLENLKHHEVSPPDKLYFCIIKRLGFNQGSKITALGKPLWWAAAAILIGGAVWLINASINNKQIDNPPLANDQQKKIIHSPVSPPGLIADSQLISKRTGIYNPKPQKKNKTPAAIKATIENDDQYISDIILDGTNYKVRNLEYFVYFTNFKKEEVPPFIRDKHNSRVLLYVDQSTSISISPAMIKMMRKLYSTRPNGTPTKRSQRIKRKMDKWKEADEVYFDKNLDKNPMNPVDLGNFLLN